jgi:hypothetical protein
MAAPTQSSINCYRCGSSIINNTTGWFNFNTSKSFCNDKCVSDHVASLSFPQTIMVPPPVIASAASPAPPPPVSTPVSVPVSATVSVSKPSYKPSHIPNEYGFCTYCERMETLTCMNTRYQKFCSMSNLARYGNGVAHSMIKANSAGIMINGHNILSDSSAAFVIPYVYIKN